MLGFWIKVDEHDDSCLMDPVTERLVPLSDPYTGRALWKYFRWPVLPRVGDYIEVLQSDDESTVVSVHHYMQANSPLIEVCIDLIPDYFNALRDEQDGWTEVSPYTS